MEFKARKIKEQNKVVQELKATTKAALHKTKAAVGKTRDFFEKTKEIMSKTGVGAAKHPYTLIKTIFRYTIALAGTAVIAWGAFLGYQLASDLKFDFSIPNIVNTFFGEDLKTDSFGRTNVLFLGVGGGLHDGPDLTDSIMIASLDHTKKTVSLFSIPRDLYVKITPRYTDRINSLYDYVKRHSGHEEAITSMQELAKKITGLDIQYYAKVNFQGFREVVDIMGGIDIDVPERLVDTSYPLEDSNGVFIRNEIFKVEKGPQHMDGDTALKYVRSRHSTSDFDRARRQQLVISALKAKALKENYLTNPTLLKQLYYAVIDNLETDINVGEAIRTASIAKDIPSQNILSVGLSDDSTSVGGFLYTPDRSLTGGASVLIPNGGTASSPEYYTEIRRLADILSTYQEMLIEKIPLKITNGTKVTGLGNQLKNKLSRYGFTVGDVSNLKTNEKNTATKIYVRGENEHKVTQEVLQTFLRGEVVLRRDAVLDPVLNGNKNQPVLQPTEPEIEIVIGPDYATYLP